MPRAQMSTAGKLIEFFRTAPMDVAEFALGQIQDALRERRAKSQAARERAKRPTKVSKPARPVRVATVVASTPKAAVARKRSHKKKSHKKKLPAVSTVEEGIDLNLLDEETSGDAEDLVETVV